MCERRGYGEVGVDELRDINHRDVGDLSSGQHLAAKVMLAIVLPAVDPSASVLGRGKLQRGVMLVGLWQLFRPVFERGEFAFGIAAVQADREATLATAC